MGHATNKRPAARLTCRLAGAHELDRVAAFSRRRPLHVIDSRGFPWIEIDFPEDYWRACTDVLPAIEAVAAPSIALPRQGAAAAASGRTAHV